MQRFLALLSLAVVALPGISFGQVVINEVMYDPQGSDSGREWVELYNQGNADVTMVGGSVKGSWRISDGSNHTLTDPAGGTGRGSLTIPAGGYLVIANDPSDFLTGEYAGGSYSVVKASLSLNNNGGIVTLLDGTGATVDSVAYSPSQGGSDDGSSLQRQADGSWIAALPTPGAANSNIVYVPPPPAPSEQSSQIAISTDSRTGEPETPAPDDSFVAPPAPSLYADAGGDRTVIAGADVEFDASAYDKTQTLLDPSTVRFIWNFGDGASAEGDAVLHHFSYPGRYAVVLDIADNKNAAEAQIVVTAEPARLSFSLLPDGGVAIGNTADTDLDLSGWVVREDAGAFAHQFVLPQDSKLLAGSSMQISPQILSFRASSSTTLEYPNGTFAFGIGSVAGSTSSPSINDSVSQPIIILPASDKPPVMHSDVVLVTTDTATSANDGGDATLDDVSVATDSDDTASLNSSSTILQAASADDAPFSRYLWWFGVCTLALAAAAALVAAARFKKGEWDIIEDEAD